MMNDEICNCCYLKATKPQNCGTCAAQYGVGGIVTFRISEESFFLIYEAVKDHHRLLRDSLEMDNFTQPKDTIQLQKYRKLEEGLDSLMTDNMIERLIT